MKITRAIVRFIKPFVNVKAWMGYTQLKEGAVSIGGSLKDIFTPAKGGVEETFEEAMQRMNLTEADIQKRKKEFFRLFIIYLIIALGTLGYTIYLANQHAIMATIASFAVTLVIVAQAFRFHFWLFQLKQRKLGCTFREWLDSGFGEEKNK